MTVECFDAEHILGFLAYLKTERDNSAKTVNNRLAALHSFANYLIFELPEYGGLLSRSLSIPFRICEKKQMGFLTVEEFEAMKTACKTKTTLGRRDMLMLLLLYNTGVRVSELLGLKTGDVYISSQNDGSYIHVNGKGRKERNIPIWKNSAKYLAAYLENSVNENDHLFSNNADKGLTRSGVRYRLGCLQKKAAESCPSLEKKTVTPHTFRHTTALRMLQSGIDIASIALWLGHESIITTHKYMEADLEMKRETLEKVGKPSDSSWHYSPDESIMAFLDAL